MDKRQLPWMILRTVVLVGLRTVALVGARRRTFAIALLASTVLYGVGILLVLSGGGVRPPNYVTIYPLPRNAATLFRSTPDLRDALALLGDEPVLEVGHRVNEPVRGVVWRFRLTVHGLADTMLVLVLLASYLTLVGVRRNVLVASAGVRGWPVLLGSTAPAGLVLLTGTATGAACCGAIPVSLLATVLGASGAIATLLTPYERLVVNLGYAVLVGSVFYEGYRLQRAACPGACRPA